MNKYKFTSKTEDWVTDSETNHTFGSDHPLWKKFQTYQAAGGQVDPWRTPEQLLEMSLRDKLTALESEYNARVDIATGTTSSRERLRRSEKRINLARKEGQGRASQKDIEELDLMEVVEDFLDSLDSVNDAIEQFLENSTLEVIENYNVQTDPNWPVMEGDN